LIYPKSSTFWTVKLPPFVTDLHTFGHSPRPSWPRQQNPPKLCSSQGDNNKIETATTSTPCGMWIGDCKVSTDLPMSMIHRHPVADGDKWMNDDECLQCIVIQKQTKTQKKLKRGLVPWFFHIPAELSHSAYLISLSVSLTADPLFRSRFYVKHPFVYVLFPKHQHQNKNYNLVSLFVPLIRRVSDRNVTKSGLAWWDRIGS